MSSKISALPAATTFGSSDVLDTLVAGLNSQCIRDVFLTALGLDTVALIGGSSTILVTSAGDVRIHGTPATAMDFTQSTGVGIFISTAGLTTVGTAIGQNLLLQGGASQSITLDTIGGIAVTTSGASSVVCTYVAANPGDWVVAPLDFASAIDRIARVVSGGGATPIP